MEAITEIHKQSKCRKQLTVVSPAPADTSATQFLPLKLREHLGRRGRKIARVRGPRYLC